MNVSKRGRRRKAALDLNTTTKLLENIFCASVDAVSAETANEWWWIVVTDGVTKRVGTGRAKTTKRGYWVLKGDLLDACDCLVDLESFGNRDAAFRPEIAIPQTTKTGLSNSW